MMGTRAKAFDAGRASGWHRVRSARSIAAESRARRERQDRSGRRSRQAGLRRVRGSR